MEAVNRPLTSRWWATGKNLDGYLSKWVEEHLSEDEALKAMEILAKAKRRRGYCDL